MPVSSRTMCIPETKITHDPKKNLCRVVLGTEGVKLAEAFDDQGCCCARPRSLALGTA